jgi:hypothetical protein
VFRNRQVDIGLSPVNFHHLVDRQRLVLPAIVAIDFDEHRSEVTELLVMRPAETGAGSFASAIKSFGRRNIILSAPATAQQKPRTAHYGITLVVRIEPHTACNTFNAATS